MWSLENKNSLNLKGQYELSLKLPKFKPTLSVDPEKLKSVILASVTQKEVWFVFNMTENAKHVETLVESVKEFCP